MSTQAFRTGQTARMRTLILSAVRPGVLYSCCQRPRVLASKMNVAKYSRPAAEHRRATACSLRTNDMELITYGLATEVTEDTEKRKRKRVR